MFQSGHFQMAGLASIFYSKFIQEILVSDWIIRSAHAQTDCFQMRSPALSKWKDLPCIIYYFIIESVFFEVPRAVFNINIGH